MKTVGFNAVEDRKDPDYVRANAPFICTRSDAWLGHGYYYWEKNEERGHEWGKSGYGGNYILGKSNLELPNILDLKGEVDDSNYLSWLLEELIENHEKFSDYKNPNDIPLSKAIQYLKSISNKANYKGLFDFDSIRGQDYPSNSKPIKFVEGRKEVSYLNPRVQICVIDRNCIINYEIIYPEQYL